MKLIDDWSKAHKFGSVQVAGALTLMLGLQAALPDFAALFKDGLPHWIPTLLGGAVIVARVLKQNLPTE